MITGNELKSVLGYCDMVASMDELNQVIDYIESVSNGDNTPLICALMYANTLIDQIEKNYTLTEKKQEK